MLAHNLYELPLSPIDLENSGPIVVRGDPRRGLRPPARLEGRRGGGAGLGRPEPRDRRDRQRAAAARSCRSCPSSRSRTTGRTSCTRSGRSRWSCSATVPCGRPPLVGRPGVGARDRSTWMSEHRIPTRVGSLAVRVRGEGPPAVLWHSLFVDERSWQRVEDGLARDRRLVIITGPGHGASSDPGHRYSLDDCAAAAGEVLAALDIREPVDWVGNAWGGHVGHRVRGDLAGPVPDPGHVRHAGPGLRPVRAAPVPGPARASIASSGMVDFLSSGIRDALLSPRTRSNDPEAVALVLDCLAHHGPAGARQRDGVDLAGAPGPDPASRVDPLPDRVRHRRRPSGVDRRPGGGDEPAARRWARRPSSPTPRT